MGSSQSSAPPSNASVEAGKPETSKTTRTAHELSLTAESVEAAIKQDTLAEWNTAFESDDKKRLAQTVLCRQDILTALVNRDATIRDAHVFNTTITKESAKVTNQMSSGRCWLFAACNVARRQVATKYDIEEFELSQSYLFFWDSLEKANSFLENMISLANEPLDSRLNQYLLETPTNDGGQWAMFQNLVKKYGLVPQSVYPESFNSSNTSKVKTIIQSKLREYALDLRELKDETATVLREDHGFDEKAADAKAIDACRQRKTELLQEIYNILVTALGTPPKVEEPFTWHFYYSKDKKYQSVTMTPLEFSVKATGNFKPEATIALINDPRNEYDQLYTVDRLMNVYEGAKVKYLNVTAKELSQAIVTCLKADRPVWFGCDVGKYSNSQLGIMDTALFDFKNALGTKPNLSKAQRLRTGESAMTHAMLISACQLDENGEAVSFRVENSWSETVGSKGFFVMSADWCNEFVYQVILPTDLAGKKWLDIWNSGVAPHVLPAYDPMGALA
ncbi:uncharacterized protein L969DRAFT_43086 [Mixia osmundae IAM 14324]|uniref:Cysteine proteinase 1, mitochondrial n=1 Tax=Mixia osmundae (strain CBS 9802 / IAM 14324 / JCM 22182 / KY 12970) TaxID=764103 RepID=G7DZZ0_MIXOS|nr:uncharacterized protein L969DRAFT_43086 [Mixia osmundae IAM 14324]KEI42142.1 hypothetical protein L969DRAFT_43086 [Mixia osmundae IAM 14324]GAA96150.1 hypothetical protein E5Q_02811 [Mixia osmundae IAM 14324]